VQRIGSFQASGNGLDIAFQLGTVAEHRLAAGAVAGNRLAQFGQPPFAADGGTDDRDAELFFQQGNIDMDAEPFGFIHDVDHQHHRQPGFHQLQGHGQHAFQVAGIHHVDHRIGMLLQQDLPGDPLLLGDGQQGIHARRIQDLVAPAIDFALPPRHGHGGARIVGHHRVGAGQGIEQNAFANIRIADQDDFAPGTFFIRLRSRHIHQSSQTVIKSANLPMGGGPRQQPPQSRRFNQPEAEHLSQRPKISRRWSSMVKLCSRATCSCSFSMRSSLNSMMAPQRVQTR
jgi:hypothetical protein